MDDRNTQPGGHVINAQTAVSSTAVKPAEFIFTDNVLHLEPVRNLEPQDQIGEMLAPRKSVESAPELSAHVPLEGNSRCINEIRNLIKKVAKTSAGVLVLGESGTGKELVAREIHRNSLRANKPFVPINCGAIPADLLESELFGHEKGAFTGALTARPGRFEMAEGGTLFLDEIGDMSLDMQVKLLRVLQEKTFERVGSNKTRLADVRVIAATHRNLEDRIIENQFREDLYYRLNVFPIEMPPLRERKSDISTILQSMAEKFNGENGTLKVDNDAMSALQHYDWPGNIRELSNVIERVCILHPGEAIRLEHLPDKIKLSSQVKFASPLQSYDSMQIDSSPLDIIERFIIPKEGVDLKELLTELELHYIKLALQKSDGVVARAAKLLKLGRTTLVEKLRKYELGRAA